MSFGSFNLFNFFQQPNTGRFTTTQEAQNNLGFILSGGNGQTGTVADFNWYFPYAFEKVPVEVISAQGVAFEFPLLSDSIVAPNVGIGLHWGTVTVAPSGDFFGDYNTMGISVGMSGDFQPLVSNSLGMYPVISGNFADFPTGFFANIVTITGNVVKDNLEQASISMSFSGDFWADYNFGLINITESGNMVKDNLQPTRIQINMSGAFKSFLSDRYNMNYAFSGVYSAASGVIITAYSGVFYDSSNVSYALRDFGRGSN